MRFARLVPRGPAWLSCDPALDLALALVCTVLLYGGFAEVAFPPWLCLLLAVPAAVPLFLRRRLGPVVTVGAALAVPAVTAGVAGNLVAWLFLPTAFALYRVAVAVRGPVSAVTVSAVLGVLLVDGLLMSLRDRAGGAAALSVGMMALIAWGAGHAVRQQRAVNAQRRAGAATEERLRIAREMHDVVAHSMSVIAVQASFGHYVIENRPDEAAAALGVIETASREVLAEMRGLLDVLRTAGPEPHDDATAPGLAGLDRLVARTSGAGLSADVEVRGEPRDLPPALDLSAYRIVQEALTNVVKHAGTPRCRVLLDYRDDELLIEVVDEGTAGRRTGTAGHGLAGMRERVDLHRGRFAAGPLPRGGYRVAARLPLGEGAR